MTLDIKEFKTLNDQISDTIVNIQTAKETWLFKHLIIGLADIGVKVYIKAKNKLEKQKEI